MVHLYYSIIKHTAIVTKVIGFPYVQGMQMSVLWGEPHWRNNFWGAGSV